MNPLGKRIIVLFMGWVLMVMAVIQVYDNVTGKNSPQDRIIAAPTAEPTVGPDPEIAQLADLQTCVAANPDDLQCTRDLADLYYKMGQYPQAMVNYESAARLSPHDYDLLVKLAGTYIYQLMFDDAVKTLQDAVALQPDSPEIHLLLGLSLSKVNPPQTAAAVAEWNKVIQLAPGSDWATEAAQLINAANAQP